MYSTLVIISESWPLGGFTEPSFIEPEIGALAARFDKIIIAPSTNRGKQTSIPPTAILHSDSARRFSLLDKIRGLFAPATWKHLLADRRQIHSLASLKSALAYSSYVLAYRKRYLNLVKKYNLDRSSTLFYSFWFDFQASAICSIPGTKVICRAHGHDAYYPQSDYYCRSWREESLSHMLACFPASMDLCSHIASAHPGFAAKIKCRLLGTDYYPPLNPPATNSTISIVSIARLSPEKRVNLLYESLRHWALSQPETSFKWVHIGDGPLMPQLKKSLHNTPPNLTVSIRGALENKQVHQILSSEHFDFCALLSSSEGLGIALCEALSHGIPLITSRIGGMPEVCTPDVGITLSENPTPAEFMKKASAALPLLPTMRVAARKKWLQCYNAEPLRHSFADEIVAL